MADAQEPAAKKPRAEAQDFIKGWPHPSLTQYPEFKEAMSKSFQALLENPTFGNFFNYGDKANGAYMLGHPDFRKVLAEFLAKQYGKPVSWETLMVTGGSSM